MAILTARRAPGPIMQMALAIGHNQLCALSVGANFHYDKTALTSGDGFVAPTSAALLVTAANAADLPTLITLLNQTQGVFQVHMKDAISTSAVQAGVHKIPDATNNAVIATAVDLPTSITLANTLKTNFNAHLSQAGVHANNDGTNSIATANGTVLADTITLANAIKTAILAHMASAPLLSMVNIIND